MRIVIRSHAILDLYVTLSFCKIRILEPKKFLSSSGIRGGKVISIYNFNIFRSVACFAWKPGHFEFQSYGAVWQKAMNAFVEKDIVISWYLAYSEIKEVGKVLM